MRIANAPCSWGMLEFEGQPAVAISADTMLDEMRETGYVGTELGDWGYLPTDPAALADMLHARGLAMTGAFVPVKLEDPAAHEAGKEHALRVARLLAAVATRASQPGPFLVLAAENGADPVRTANAGRITPAMGLDDAGWAALAQGVDEIARAVTEETGLPLVFHHHCAGWVETPAEIERLLDATDPDRVGLVFDTGHFAFGQGHDAMSPVAMLDRIGDRVRLVHFKDCDPAVTAEAREKGWDYLTAIQHGVFCELGKGDVDFPAVRDWLTAHGYDGWIVVEQDVLPGLGTPRESAARNRAYLRGIDL